MSGPHPFGLVVRPGGLLVLALVLTSSAVFTNQQSAEVHPNHKIDGSSIDVSSSIGVSMSGSPGAAAAGGAGGAAVTASDVAKMAEAAMAAHPHRAHHAPALVEDLLANESGNLENIHKVAPGGPNLNHAAVLDTDSDLIGAESESKFSLSKLKRPFSRIPFDLRLNNRFLNSAAQLFSSGSHNAPQHQPPPNFLRHPPPPPQAGFMQPNRPMFRPPPPPQGPNFGQGPMFKSLNMKPHGPPNGQMPPPPQGFNGPMGNMQAPPPPQQAQPDIDPSMVHAIADFISEENQGRPADIGSDLDIRQPLASPSNDIWPLSTPDLAKIVNLDVKCEKNFMKVAIEFDRPYNGLIFSKGFFSHANCIHLPAGSGRSNVHFDIRMDHCGTTGNMGSNSLVPAGQSAAGNFFENTVIFQYDPFVQEAWDQARKLRCTWHDQYEKSVSFRPFPVDMVDVVRADFAGDNVGCWMQIQVGRGPWASEVAGIVKIGQTMTMVLAIKDEESKFDMLVRNCVAHDGKRQPIELVDTNGCIVRSKLMSKFTKIKNFGSSASVLSYAHFQAFKFPDSMEVHFQCTIQICKHSCPEQCDPNGHSNVHYVNHQISGTLNTQTGQVYNQQMQPEGSSLYINTVPAPGEGGDRADSVIARPREVRDVSKQNESVQDLDNKEEVVGDKAAEVSAAAAAAASKEVGLNKVIKVVSPSDLSFSTTNKLTALKNSKDTEIEQEGDSSGSNQSNSPSKTPNKLRLTPSWLSEHMSDRICMSSLSFVVCFLTLFSTLLLSCTCSVVLCCRRRANRLAGFAGGAGGYIGGGGGGADNLMKSAKESSLSKKDPRKHENEYGPMPTNTGSGTLVPVMGGGGGHSYLSSSSVLSPRLQAGMYH